MSCLSPLKSNFLMKNVAESRHKSVFERFQGPSWVPKWAPKARPKMRRKTHAKQIAQKVKKPMLEVGSGGMREAGYKIRSELKS